MELHAVILALTLTLYNPSPSPTDQFFSKIQSRLINEVPTIALEPAMQRAFPKEMLQQDCLVHAQKWREKMLHPLLYKESSKSAWFGISEKGDPFAYFVSSWKSRLGQAEWIDAGCLASIRFRLSAPRILSSKDEAGESVREVLESALQLPSVDESLIKLHIREPFDIEGKSVFCGYLQWGLKTKVDRVVDGVILEKPLEPLRWRHSIYFVTDGEFFGARMNYFEEDADVTRKFTDKDYRIKKHAGSQRLF